MTNALFPGGRPDEIGRMNFPLAPKVNQIRIQLGEIPASISIVRICLERSLVITHCVDGSALPRYIEASHDTGLSPNGQELTVVSSSPESFIVLGAGLAQVLQPDGDLPLMAVGGVFFVAATMFLFCFFAALLTAVKGSADAAIVFGLSATLRAAFHLIYQPGVVSDSDWFLRYLQFHIFSQPGSRGILYPIFTSLFGTYRDGLFVAQAFLGATGSVLILLLLRSLKKPSRWDILWALLASSFPVLLAAELIVLAESLSLFFILAVLLALRGLEAAPRRGLAAAGLGCCCALLFQTKPQFTFVPVLCLAAVVLLAARDGGTWNRALRQAALFALPVLALYAVSMRLNYSSGNFAGTSSMLGYSLFNHAQQTIECVTPAPDPHVLFYCEARKALGPNSRTTSYTAWVIYPSMFRLNEPFTEVTADYMRLSLRIFLEHPALYAQSVFSSFVDFWTGTVDVTNSVYLAGDRGYPGARRLARSFLPAERWIRNGIATAWLILFLAVLAKRAWPTREGFATWGMLYAITLASAVVQALVESGENSRYALPTEPLLWIGIVTSVVFLRSANAKTGLLKNL